MVAVDRDEVDRLRKRFMKLDKVRMAGTMTDEVNLTCACLQDNSGTIEREEFLSLPQVSSNPLATRYARRHLSLHPGQAPMRALYLLSSTADTLSTA